MPTERAPVTTLDIPDGERPDPAVIAARIDVGSAEYHDTCCPWMLYAADASLFDVMPSCSCGGGEMAKWYVEFATALRQLADGNYPEDYSPGAFAEAVLREQRP